MSIHAAAVDGAVCARGEGRPALAGAWVVSAAMLASGVLIYAFHAGAARALGSSAYGQVAVLWSAMFLVVIVVFRPLEQAMSRGIADRLARGEEARSVVLAVVTLAAAIFAAFVPVAAVLWDDISGGLFRGDDTMTAMLAVGIVAYGIAYVSRGIVAGLRWFAGYGLGLVADAVARLAIAAPLLFVDRLDVAAAAVAVAGLAGALVPLATGRARLRALAEGRPAGGFRLGRTLRFTAPASVIAATDQLLVNCGPLLVIAEGGAPQTAGLVFAATMLVRVPTYVFQGLASSILPNLARLNAGDGTARFRAATLEAAGLLLAVGGAIVAFAALAGPEALRLVYGPDFDAGRGDLVLLGVGVACYLAATTFSQALLALEASAASALAWALTAALFVALYFGLPGTALERISMALPLATLADLLLLGALLHARTRRR